MAGTIVNGDTIMISLLIMNNELEPHTLRVYDPEDHFS